MPDLKQITLPSGTTYDLVDQGARDLIAELESYSAYLGVTATALSDGASTNPIAIGGKLVTAKKGDIVNYSSKEFIFNGTIWQEFGDLSGLGSLAFKDSAQGSYTPEGTVSQATFTGEEMTATGSFTPSGSVSAPNITVTPSTDSINGLDAVGTLPALTMTVQNENLTIAWNAGTLPTKSASQTFVTGITSATASAPEFTGTSGNVSVKGTPNGSVSGATFTGTAKNVTVS